ncbi:MAG TPA: endolytic transglycosylase MltG [Promineifilum sp.]|nr:endolytic transglycosylase MltG [Promineifilum sp.]
MTNEPIAKKRSLLGRLLQIAIAVVVVAVFSIAMLILYRIWLGEGLDRTAVNPHLSQTQRLYLEYYLTEHAAELSEVVGAGHEPQFFTILPGEHAATIATNLQRTGLLNNPELFLNYLTYYGLDGSLVSGDYRLDPRQTLPQLVESLGAGGARRLELVFLPGWRSEEMANYLRVVAPARIDADAFLDIINTQRGLDLSSFAFLASLPAGASLEGYLFPGTYPIDPDTDSATLVRLMLERFDEQVTPEMRQAFGAQGISFREALILASIIEKEATLPEEKPLMAAVFLNRLRAGMPLQADPTVQYGLGYDDAAGTWWKTPLTATDLAVESPYNTYLIEGLPPGSISNPSLASLQAIANPAAVDFLFFVLDCDAATPGQHVFSVTYEEHLSHVERCR